MPNSDIKIWNSDFLTEDMYRKINIMMNTEDNPKRLACHDSYSSGEPVGPGFSMAYPVGLRLKFYDLPEKYKRNWTDLFVNAPYVFASKRFCDVLQQFDLGATSFREMPLYEYDKVTPRPADEGPFFLIHILEYQDAFVPERSEDIKEFWNTGTWRGGMGVMMFWRLDPLP
ncbi:MAG: hypothetical protein AAGF53_09155 [Pseudomonadota bacterium]